MTAIDAASATIIVAIVATLGTLANTIISMRQNKQINETHKQVTVNHHSSESPTVLDRIDDVQQAVLLLATGLTDMRGDFTKHLIHSNEMDLRMVSLEVVKDTKDEIRLANAENEVKRLR